MTFGRSSSPPSAADARDLDDDGSGDRRHHLGPGDQRHRQQGEEPPADGCAGHAGRPLVPRAARPAARHRCRVLRSARELPTAATSPRSPSTTAPDAAHPAAADRRPSSPPCGWRSRARSAASWLGCRWRTSWRGPAPARPLLLTLVIVRSGPVSLSAPTPGSSSCGKGIPALLASFGPEDVRLINTPWAVLIGIVYGYLPLMVFPIYVSLEKLDKRLLEASADLGAARLRLPADHLAAVRCRESSPGDAGVHPVNGRVPDPGDSRLAARSLSATRWSTCSCSRATGRSAPPMAVGLILIMLVSRCPSTSGSPTADGSGRRGRVL